MNSHVKNMKNKISSFNKKSAPSCIHSFLTRLNFNEVNNKKIPIFLIGFNSNSETIFSFDQDIKISKFQNNYGYDLPFIFKRSSYIVNFINK